MSNRLCVLMFLTTVTTVTVAEPKSAMFDMEAIRDPTTLAIEVLQDWHNIDAGMTTRQKLVTISVGNIWPGQQYRIPVRMVVPSDRKATGFHLTGGNTPDRLKRDMRLSPIDQELIKRGVGLVSTVVQEPGSYGQARLARESEARFAKSLDPSVKIQYCPNGQAAVRVAG